MDDLVMAIILYQPESFSRFSKFYSFAQLLGSFMIQTVA